VVVGTINCYTCHTITSQSKENRNRNGPPAWQKLPGPDRLHGSRVTCASHPRLKARSDFRCASSSIRRCRFTAKQHCPEREERGESGEVLPECLSKQSPDMSRTASRALSLTTDRHCIKDLSKWRTTMSTHGVSLGLWLLE
jgi:hypothetical protein